MKRCHVHVVCIVRLSTTNPSLIVIGQDLLQERDSDASSDLILPGGDAMASGLAGYDWDDHAEDHPTGKTHVLVAGSSCFSFNIVPRHNKPMAAIHHPNV